MPGDDRLKKAYEERVRALEASNLQRERELMILSQVAARVHGEEEPERILEIALDEILTRMGLTAAWIFVGDDDDRKLRLATARGVAASYLEEVRTQGLGECLCPEVFWSGHRMQARNTTQCPRMPDIIDGLSAPVAHACVPLKFEGGVRGVLNVAARPGEQFSEEELRFMETLGHQIGLAVERGRHREGERRTYRELKEAQQRVLQSEKMAVLGTFASGLAHEVRNPLNSIALQVSLLERRIARLDATAGRGMREMADTIREEIRRLDGLVGDFLLFSRTDHMQEHRADLEALLDEVLRLLEPEASGSAVRLVRRRVGAALPQFRMDAEKIKQVVINLVRNAVEAMPAGGAITVESGLLDGQAVLTVSDTGPGLPEGLDVFQLFVTTKPKGTGLGLSIVQQIVLQHGGEIAAQSPPGQGASFTIRLPLTAAGEGGQS